MKAVFSELDHAHMEAALCLAKRGLGPSSPNPSVGCRIIAANGRVAGEGFTQPFGGSHAEPIALAAAAKAAKGGTAYVTLMPCAHTGKTPPCTDALIAAGIRRVVVALDDPNPESRNGAGCLREAGIQVDIGLLADPALEMISGFVKHLKTGLPLLRLKYAMTLDGRIATRTGSSQWISGPDSRELVQTLRRESDAVLVGSGTALADNPRLNVRDPKAWQPRRVVIDSRCRMPHHSNLFTEHGGKVVMLTTDQAPAADQSRLAKAGADVIPILADSEGRVSLEPAIHALGHLGVRSILCEGGGALGGALIDAGLVDEIIAFIAPKVVGGAKSPGPLGGTGVELMSEALSLEKVILTQTGTDLCVRGRVGSWPWAKGII